MHFGSNVCFFEASGRRVKVFAWCQKFAKLSWVGRQAGLSSPKNAWQGQQCDNWTGCGHFGSLGRVLVDGRCCVQNEDNGGRDDRWGGRQSGKARHARLPYATVLYVGKVVGAVEREAVPRECGFAGFVQACLASGTEVSFGADASHFVVHGTLQQCEPHVWQRQI